MGTNVQSEGVSRTRQLLAAMLAVGVVLGASMFTAPTATAQVDLPLTTVRCGQVLTSSLLVANDLTDCPGDGLVAGADGVTVDLGGRTLDGVGLGAGIRVEGRSGVTVTGGTIRDFDLGVLVGPGTARTDLSGLSLEDNQEAGVLLAGAASGNEVRDNKFTRNALAVGLVDGTESAAVVGNTVGEGGGHGFLVSHAAGNRLERNTVSGGSDAGLVLESASRNVLRGNLVNGVSDAAVLLEAESDGNLLDGNELTDSDGGIIVDGSTGNIVTGNTVHGMSDNGIDLEGSHGTVVRENDLRFNGEGLALFDATRNWVEENETSNSNGTAIILEGASTDNVLLSNIANDNAAGGIAAITLGEPDHGNLISGNTASRNQGSGIEISGVGDTLRSNVADENSAWGITATGAVDGGGNLATGNSEPAQCSGIVCNSGLPPEPDADPPATRITDQPLHPSAVTYGVFAFEADGEGDVRFECALDGSTFSACTSPTTYAGLPLGWHTFVVRSIDAAGNVDPEPVEYSWSIEEAPPVDCGSAVTLLADADAWLDQNSSTTNKGEDSALKIRSKGPSDNFRTVVRFPLPKKPDGCAVEAAELSLYSSGAAPNRTLQALRITSSWSESTVTWANQPPATGPAASTSSGEGWRHWAVKGLVQDMYDTGAGHGFLLRDAIEGADAEQGLSTRDSDVGPRLVVRLVPVVVDTTPPRTAITGGPGETTTDTAATFEFTADEPGSTFTCTLDGGDPEPCTSPQHYTGLTTGVHTFTVAATDTAGNTDLNPATRTWTVEAPLPPADTTPPVVTVTGGPADPTTDTAATFTFSADDDTATITCTLDGGLAEPCTSPTSFTGLATGVHTFTVTAADQAGNTGTALWAWAIQDPPPPPDTTAPDTTITGGPDDPTTDTDASFTFESDEPGSTFTCTLDGGEPEPCTSPHGYSGLTVGVHTLTVAATDQAGNVDPTPATRTWTVEEPAPPPDTTPPTVTITGGPADPTTDTAATFSFTVDDDTATITCTLDGGEPEACTSPTSYTGLTVGVHTLTVAATDPAGNTGTALWAWAIQDPPPPPDTTPPTVTITGGPADPTTDTAATFSFTVDDDTATITCTLDGGEPEACTSPTSYTGLTVGVHTLTVAATDPAGNTGTALWAWAIQDPPPPPDTTPPTVTITGGPADATTDTTATFTFEADEPSTFTCTLDGGLAEPCTSPTSYTGLTVGVHTLTVAATDPAGNTGQATHRWTVEAPAPPPDCGRTVTLTSTADAWLDQNSSSTNKGSDAIIKVRSKQPRDNFRSLVRFALPPVPTGCVVESATLRLYAAAHTSGRTIQAYRVTSAWAEATVTWASQPSTTGPAVSTPSGPGWREWSVGSQVQAMSDPAAAHGFLLRDAVESADREQQFHAREKEENPPELVIRYSPAP